MAGLTLDEDTQSVVTADGNSLSLTGIEFRLLRYFMLHPGKVLSKTRLAEHVYDFHSDRDSNVLEVYVNRLRRKLGRNLMTSRRVRAMCSVTTTDALTPVAPVYRHHHCAGTADFRAAGRWQLFSSPFG